MANWPLSRPPPRISCGVFSPNVSWAHFWIQIVPFSRTSFYYFPVGFGRSWCPRPRTLSLQEPPGKEQRENHNKAYKKVLRLQEKKCRLPRGRWRTSWCRTCQQGLGHRGAAWAPRQHSPELYFMTCGLAHLLSALRRTQVMQHVLLNQNSCTLAWTKKVFTVPLAKCLASLPWTCWRECPARRSWWTQCRGCHSDPQWWRTYQSNTQLAVSHPLGNENKSLTAAVVVVETSLYKALSQKIRRRKRDLDQTYWETRSPGALIGNVMAHSEAIILISG